VSDETGALQLALVHTPGREISNLSPGNHREYLFNDLLYERYARREHDEFVALLHDVFGVQVLFFRELLAEAVGRANSMDRLRLLETVSLLEHLGPRDQERLLRLINAPDEATAEHLADRLIAGEPVGAEDSSVSEFLNMAPYHLPPIPNLMLVRDLAAVIGADMFLAWNSARVRRRENLLWRFILQHSEIRHDIRWHTWMVDDEEAPEHPPNSLEGGNIVQLAPNVILIGQSSRTGPSAVEKLTTWLTENAAEETHLFIVLLPEPFDHLDTVFTMLSRTECVVFPPSIFGNGPESVNVLRVTIRPGDEPSYARLPELLGPLSEVLGCELRAVSCGGSGPIDQRREQWWGGASILAVAPSKLIAFRSAGRTAAELKAQGYALLDSRDVLSGRADPHEHEKVVVLIRGSEISRARGGPRSLVLPLVRAVDTG